MENTAACKRSTWNHAKAFGRPDSEPLRRRVYWRPVEGSFLPGALDRWFTAYDADTGDTLWRTRLNDVPNSSPISYLVKDKQYIAIVVGHGGFQSLAFLPLVPEIRLPAAQSAVVWVFELPDGVN